MHHFPCKRLMAHLLLFGQLISSCSTPNALRLNQESPRSTQQLQPYYLPVPTHAAASNTPVERPYRRPSGIAKNVLYTPLKIDPLFANRFGQLGASPKLRNSLSLWPNASPIPPLTTKEGYTLRLISHADGYQARLTDPRFPGMPVKLLPVHFAPKYSLDRLAQRPSPPIQLLRTTDGQEIVYVGPAGLLGGGPGNWLGLCDGKCTWFGCFKPVYACLCGFQCPDNSCINHCTNHQSAHRCARCCKKCPQYYSCSSCASSKYCSSCCGCIERAEAARQREAQLRREAESARAHAAHRAQLQAQWSYQCQQQAEQRAQERAAQEASQRRKRAAEAAAERRRQQRLRAERERLRREQEHQQVVQEVSQTLAQAQLNPAEDAKRCLANQPAPVRRVLDTCAEQAHVVHHTASDLLWEEAAACAEDDSSSDEATFVPRPNDSVAPLESLSLTQAPILPQSKAALPLVPLTHQPPSDPAQPKQAPLEHCFGKKTAVLMRPEDPTFSLETKAKTAIPFQDQTTLPSLQIAAIPLTPIPLRRPEAPCPLGLSLSTPDKPIDASFPVPFKAPQKAKTGLVPLGIAVHKAKEPLSLDLLLDLPLGVATPEAEAAVLLDLPEAAAEAQQTPHAEAPQEASHTPPANPTPEAEEDPWTYELLLQSIVDGPQTDALLLDDFRSKWYDLQARHTQDELAQILRVLNEQKYAHGLSLRRINALLDQLQESGSTGYALLCGPRGPQTLHTHWLTGQASRLAWPATDQERLMQALSALDWSPFGLRFLVDALEEETPSETLWDFLAFAHTQDLPESLVLPTLEQRPLPNQTKAAHWTHVLAHQHLLYTLAARAPEAAKILDQPLYQLLSSCPYRPIQDALETHLDAIVGHPDAFAAVLQQLHTYPLTPAAYAAALARLADAAPTDWEATLDQHIVSALFQESHELTPTELLAQIAQTSPEASQGLATAYAALCAAFEAAAASLQGAEEALLKKLAAKPISQWKKTDIPLWAAHAKASSPTQAECLAVLQQAARLHHGFLPRATQCLALLTLLNPCPEKGRLAQINTGEGKSLIVAMLAAYHALRGKTVDVVTTSTELSRPEVEKQRPFFALLGLTAAENSQVETKTAAYQCPIVYGTTSDFQGDLLKAEFLGQPLRGNRGFGVVLVDEVDSMLFDNRTQSVRLSEATPGMYHLEMPLAAIWEHIHRLTRHLVEVEGNTYFISEEFTLSGKRIQLLNGGPWRDYAHPVADKRRFLTEKTQEYLTTLLRDLTPAEAEAYALYQALNGTLATLRNKAQMASQQQTKANQDLTAKKEQAVVDQHTSWWMFPDYKARIQQEVRQSPEFQNLVDTLSSRTSEMRDLEDQIAQHQAEEKRQTKAIDTLQTQLDTLPWNQRHPILEVPAHLRALARSQLPYWIKNALNAAFAYQKEAHYDVRDGRIVPIHYNETGVLQTNMVWSDGLTQFLQIKEGLALDPENLSTNFLSNVSFFQRYGSHLYGLTGTLGGASTQTFLHEIYGTDQVVIPPYKQRKISCNEATPYLCKELTPQAAVDIADWYQSLVDNTLYHARQQRAVLVICKYIRQVKHLAKALTKRYDAHKIFTYTGQEATFGKSTIDSGEILIATNIAGRGTDLQTSEAVEKNGGLYVAVSFLPESYRVEMQNVGRTARAGKKGMAQLIVHDPSGSDPRSLKVLRAEQERVATDKALQDAKQMLLQDDLFTRFCRLENHYLPDPNTTNKRLQWQHLVSHWNQYVVEALTPAQLQAKSEQWQNEQTERLLEECLQSLPPYKRSKLTPADLAHFRQEAQQKAAAGRPNFERQHKQEALDRFCKIYQGHLPDELLDCLAQGVPYAPQLHPLAVTHRWSGPDRKGFEETWAIWLQQKHLEDPEAPRGNRSLADQFEGEFAAAAHRNAPNDRLLTNPYWYVLKGNQALSQQQRAWALQCYDRAIALDPLFSLYAQYNKAHTLLSYKKNRGYQDDALVCLQKAHALLDTLYRPALLSFHTLVGQTGTKAETSQHVQQQLDILGQQETHIRTACILLEKAKSKGHNVALTSISLFELFAKDPDSHKRALQEAATNGLSHLFTLEVVKPTPWWSLVGLTCLAAAQITAGCFITACTAGALGSGLISEGVSDLITAVKSAISGSFSWAAWATQKAISLAVSLISSGWNAVKKGLATAQSTCKNLLGKTAVGTINEGPRLAARELATAFGKAALNECVTQAGNWVANQTVLAGLEKKILQQVETALLNAFQSNARLLQALKQDGQSGNNHWYEHFLRAGSQLLAQQPDHPCFQLLKSIALGVAKSNIPGLTQYMQLDGVMEMLDQLTNYTHKFIAQFNALVDSCATEIAQEATRIPATPVRTVEVSAQCVTVEAPSIDLDEDAIPVNIAKEGAEYTTQVSRVEALRSTYVPKQESTPAGLVHALKHPISNLLLGTIRTNLVAPAMAYGASALTQRLFRQVDETTASLKEAIHTEYQTTYISNQVANASKEKDKQKEKHKNNKKDPSSDLKSSTPLNPEAKKFIESLSKDEVHDETSLALMASALGKRVIIYDANGKPKRVFGHKIKGEAIHLTHIPPSAENPAGHWGTLNTTQTIVPSGKNSCALDAVFVQLPPEKQAELKNAQGLKAEMAKAMQAKPEAANELFSVRAKLKEIAPDRLREGGYMELLLESVCRNDPNDLLFRDRLSTHNPEYQKAEQKLQAAQAQGDTEQIQKYSSQLDDIAEAEYKRNTKEEGRILFRGFMHMGRIVSLLYCNPGAYTAFDAGLRGEQVISDDVLRERVKDGDIAGAWEHGQDHLPLWGPMRNSARSLARKEYIKSGLYAADFALDVSFIKSFKGVLGCTKQGNPKLLGPVGDPAGRSILHKPEGWITKMANNKQGTKIVNPKVKDGSDYIRFSSANPHPKAPPGQQYNYFERYKNGKVLTKDGQWVCPKTHPNKKDFHIPQDKFEELKPLLDLD